MTLQDYLRVLRERWRIVVAAVLIALVAAGATWYLRPAEYTANLTMYVSSQGGDTASAAYQGAQLSQQRVTSYVELVSSRRVSEEVIAQLGLDQTADSLSRQITASSALDSVLIDVTVADEDPERAAELANTVGTVFTRLVDELERPVDVAAPQAVAVRVVQPAVAPAVPSSTGLAVTLALGLLAGLAVGVGGALARSALDTSVKSPDQLRELAKVPNLGFIAYDPAVPKRPLTVHEDPQSPRAEAFRQLRTNLQFVDVDRPRKVIVLTSSLPSEGKTTTLANLAIALASTGQRVLAIEADLRRPKLSATLGVDSAVGLTSVLSGRVAVTAAIQNWSGGVDVLASGPLPPNPSELLSSQQMRALLTELRGYYDTILIDTPPLLPVTDAAAVAPATDGVLLVCRFKATTSDHVVRSVEALDAVSADLLGTVFTMVPASGPRAYAQYNAYYRSQLPIGASSAEVDLRERPATFDYLLATRPDVVVLAAAKVGGIVANDTYSADFLSENLRIQVNVMDAAQAAGVERLLFLGSSCIYPKFAEQPIRESSLLTGPLEPTNDAYAIAKIAGIKQVQAHRKQHGVRWISAMPTNLYGPGDNFHQEHSHVLPALIRRFHEAVEEGRDEVVLWGSGTPRREFLHVDDLGRAIVHLLDVYDDPETINVGVGSDVTIHELAETVADVVGFQGRITLDPSRPDGTPRKLLDVSRINALGWEARISLREGIASTYRWFVDHHADARLG